MASLLLRKLHGFALFTLILIPLFAVSVASFQFQVGGKTGWIKPTGNETETYNEWATQNRFHIGDFLYFKYQDDSVLVVNHSSYESCSVSNPLVRFEDGNTVFRFDRYGFFYFISGEPGHCTAGQKLIVRVMVHSAVLQAPQSAASPGAEAGGPRGGDGWDSFNWGPPSLNSTIRLTVTSYLMTALGGMLVILYLLM